MLIFIISLLILIPFKLERIRSLWLWGSFLWTLQIILHVYTSLVEAFPQATLFDYGGPFWPEALMSVLIGLMEVGVACLVVYFIKKHRLKKRIANSDVSSAPVQQVPPTLQQSTPGLTPPDESEQAWL